MEKQDKKQGRLSTKASEMGSDESMDESMFDDNEFSSNPLSSNAHGSTITNESYEVKLLLLAKNTIDLVLSTERFGTDLILPALGAFDGWLKSHLLLVVGAVGSLTHLLPSRTGPRYIFFFF